MLWKKDIIKMSSFDWNKNIEDSIKDGLILTATTTGIFFALKAANVKLPKASLDAMDIIKLAGGICGGELMIDYVAYKNGSTNDTIKNLWLPKGNEIKQRQMQTEKHLYLDP